MKVQMNPKYPLYIVSKGRWESRLTIKALELMKIPYKVIIEKQEYEKYASVIDKKKLLILPKEKYHSEYEVCDEFGLTKSPGSGPARNFAWDHSTANGFKRHWTIDDNIRAFWRLDKNKKLQVYTGGLFTAMEEFVDRYTNIAMAGPHYYMFASARSIMPPFILNTRVYSCNLIKNDAPYRWRSRYNEDTDLSLRMLKDGWCTVLFFAFLQQKMPTQTMKGGNTELYKKDGTFIKSKLLKDLHPDITKIKWRFGRIHHYVNYQPFRKNKLIRRKDIELGNKSDNFNMKYKKTKQMEPIRITND